MANPIKIGIGGPVGAGKTQLIEKVVKRLSKEMSIGVITNDIYTKEDEKILVNSGVILQKQEDYKKLVLKLVDVLILRFVKMHL